jgi:hypothetical protein
VAIDSSCNQHNRLGFKEEVDRIKCWGRSQLSNNSSDEPFVRSLYVNTGKGLAGEETRERVERGVLDNQTLILTKRGMIMKGGKSG